MIAQSRSMFTLSAALLSAATLVGCATSTPASAPAAVVISAPPPAEQHDSVQRFQQMDRVAMQIVRGTASTAEEDYRTRVRPRLTGPLQRLGFSEHEIRQILSRVDDARADRQRVRNWFARR